MKTVYALKCNCGEKSCDYYVSHFRDENDTNNLMPFLGLFIWSWSGFDPIEFESEEIAQKVLELCKWGQQLKSDLCAPEWANLKVISIEVPDNKWICWE